MNLPEACDKCRPFSGAWQETENGMARCDCPRGMALRKPVPEAAAQPAILAEQSTLMYAEMLAGGMDFYPNEAAARGFIASEIGAMCNSDAEALWLVREMHRRYDGRKWPGVVTMRALHCSRHEPRDGVSAISEAIEEAQEQEYRETLQLAPPSRRMLAAGDTEAQTAAQSIADTIHLLGKAKDLNRTSHGLPSPKVPEIPVKRLTAENRITPEMIAAAERENREKQAREEIGVKA